MNRRSWCVLLAILLMLSAAVGADETSWRFEWDRRLPSLVLHDVSVEAENLRDAWTTFISDHLVRSVLVLPDQFGSQGHFEFRRANCTVSDFLDVLCERYSCQWDTDEATGVTWIGPQNWRRKIPMDEQVEIPRSLRAVPMHTDVLQEYLVTHFRILRSSLRRDLNGCDYAVSIAAGTYSIHDLLNRCLLWNPSLTFLIDYDTIGRKGLLEVSISRHEEQSNLEGAALFWEVESGQTNRIPAVEELIQWLGDQSPRKRWTAQNYRRLSQGPKEICNRLASGLLDESEIRALHAFLLSWIPRMIPVATPKDLQSQIQMALESSDFENFRPQVRLRLVALALATSDEMFLLEAKSELMNSNPDELHLDADPGVVAAREAETAWRETVLQKLPEDIEEVLTSAEFDVRAFLNLYPRVAEYLRSQG